MKRMKKTGRPLVLTVNGKAEVVLLDAAAYQQVASIRCGLLQAEKGMGRPVSDVFDELEREDSTC